jgi:hypothetical protein
MEEKEVMIVFKGRRLKFNVEFHTWEDEGPIGNKRMEHEIIKIEYNDKNVTNSIAEEIIDLIDIEICDSIGDKVQGWRRRRRF